MPSIAMFITPVLSHMIPASAPRTMGVESLRLRSKSPTISNTESIPAQIMRLATAVKEVTKKERFMNFLKLHISGVSDPAIPRIPRMRIDLPVCMEREPSSPKPMRVIALPPGN